MKKLSYATLKNQKYEGYVLEKAPERFLQFGEGNFMRAFVDYFIDVMNEKVGFNSKVVLCQPIETGLADTINEQEGLYTLYLRGSENGKKVSEKRLISCVSRCINPYKDYEALMECAKNPELRFITCNTTEAGIVYDPSCKFQDKPASSYPGKLVQFMYERYKHFGNEKGRGFVILSCELINNNGKELEKCVLEYSNHWNLGKDFEKWIKEENIFCSTLVDRIVTGYPSAEAEEICKENGYIDKLIDTGEIFGLWVIEGPESLKEELPFEKAGLPVLITRDHTPYKQQKVRILNGAHTSMIMGAYLAGKDIVRDCMRDEIIQKFMNKTIYEEIIPTLTLSKSEAEKFAGAVTDRFKNPFIDHSLLAISLNSTSKWKARVLPSMKGYMEKYKKLPVCITASFAFYIKFYMGESLEKDGMIGKREDTKYRIIDDYSILEFFYKHRTDDENTLVHAVCSNTDLWNEDLTKIPGFEEMVSNYLKEINKTGTYQLMKDCL